MDDNATPKRPRPHFYNGVSLMANRFVIAAVVLVVAVVLVPVGVWAANNHPDGRNASRIERRIAEIYGRPDTGSDDKVVGDILIERFYAVDPETGQRYIGDVVKGASKGYRTGPTSSARRSTRSSWNASRCRTSARPCAASCRSSRRRRWRRTRRTWASSFSPAPKTQWQ